MRTIFVFVVALLSAPTFAATPTSNCGQANLASTDGTQITVRYPLVGSTDGDVALVVPTIRAVLPSGKCNVQFVTALLVANPHAGCGNSDLEVSVDLKPTGNPCEYQAVSSQPVQFANHCSTVPQQIAVQVLRQNQSQFLVNPENQSHNFDFDFLIKSSQSTAADFVCN